MTSWRWLVALFVVVGIVLSSLRAMAATIPMLVAYDEAARPTVTTVLGEHDAVRPEAEHPCINAYDAAHVGYDDGPSNARVGAGTVGLHAYDDDPEYAGRTTAPPPLASPQRARQRDGLAVPRGGRRRAWRDRINGSRARELERT